MLILKKICFQFIKFHKKKLVKNEKEKFQFLRKIKFGL